MRLQATSKRLEEEEKNIADPQTVMTALAREEMMIIHHNHEIATKLSRQRTEFTREMERQAL